jgi:LPXTG-motif cell wall-anchored protein
VPIVVVPGPVVVAGAPVGLAATGSDATLPLGLAGLLLVAGLVSLRVARLRRRSRAQRIG